MSGEIVLEKLIETLVRTAIEQAGAERGLLILLQGEAQRIAAEATTSGDGVIVQLRDEPVTAAMLPESVLHYVLRTRESVILDDAAAQSPFAADPYLRQRQARSILCLPLINQAKLIGVLYLENNLAAHVFAPARIAALTLLASQAAISLENTHLYAERQRDAAALREQANLLSLTHDAIFVRALDGVVTYWNRGAEALYGWSDSASAGQGDTRPAEDGPPAAARANRGGSDAVPVAGKASWCIPRRTEPRWWWRAVGRCSTTSGGLPVAILETNNDITERKRAEEALHLAQAELAHVTRVATLGELAASIAHELNQPLAALVNSAHACVRWLAAHDLEHARESALRVVADGHRAADIIHRLRALAQKAPPQRDWFDLNAAIREVLVLVQSDVHRHGVALATRLAGDVPPLWGDRIQVQQVLLNLLMNALEALSEVAEGPRELGVSSQRGAAPEVVIAVRDSGPGLDSPGARPAVRRLLYDQAARPGPGAGDQPLDHRGPRRPAVGRRAGAPRRRLSVHVADGA